MPIDFLFFIINLCGDFNGTKNTHLTFNTKTFIHLTFNTKTTVMK